MNHLVCLGKRSFAEISAETHFCLEWILKICVYLRPILYFEE